MLHQRLLVCVDGGPKLIEPGPALVCRGDEKVLTLEVKGVLQMFHGENLFYKQNNPLQVQSG